MKSASETGWWSLIQDVGVRQQIADLRETTRPRLLEPRWAAERAAVASIQDLRAASIKTDGPSVTIGGASELGPAEHDRLDQALRAFIPWKKGPFSIFGHDIDAEWRSDWKWDRFWPYIRTLKDEVVADIGCNNGYFMYRMLDAGAKHVVGFEPMARHALNFELLQNLHPTPALDFEMLGVEHIELFPEVFDTIFCLGILYHHTDPVGLLRKLAKALKYRGRLFIDCQGIPGDDPVALTPAGRYAGAGGVWFLPTRSCLENWIKRAGYTRIQWIHAAPLSPSEQRATEWAPLRSLPEFLQTDDPTKTIEGYPAPERFYVMVQL
ncbi:MAG TPA: tRNA 5-methoxyuridine(34)/uridine 5-oxyacetic acid(34) synthase CmoB [Oligoflexus sp.]|uniref:tRNA 5-methoxyuridine(34)/uridine 5-oxyacetic acid(34) synthase CmoB n=1 Tax=Oligoflexus sp. TaxID=1971216 RepID=UPI002D258D91|nr:tRNA 5-methoxyuridine(34)/uridine 5-oxyacetic acid(34) synthase CmoB [Oligoflexus sp.]HYX37021.1 tRNA 5-methoxyuridine(34)/uridine 5-oxyacetic acid(34) synthase CmoB [Oligoflexus sp.]